METYTLEALRAGDQKAYRLLVEQEGARIYRCVARYLRDEHEAQSVVQETFLQAFRRINDFRGDAKLSTWLCAIGINLARAALRKKKRYDLLEEQDIERLQPNFSARGHYIENYEAWNPQDFTERNEAYHIVHQALDRLPDDYRAVVVLRDLEGYNTTEAAEILGISEGAARVRLHRARQALRSLLDDYAQTD